MNAYILAVIVPAFEFGIQRIDCFRVVPPCYHNTYRTTHPPTHLRRYRIAYPGVQLPTLCNAHAHAAHHAVHYRDAPTVLHTRV